MSRGAWWLSGKTLSDGDESSGSSPCMYVYSEFSVAIHSHNFPLVAALCKKEDYRVVWVLNSYVQ